MRKKIVENVNGYTMHVDDKDTLALSWHHVYEPATTDFFCDNIKKGQTVIDIGANIGYFTLLFSGLVGEEGHIYAFEPEPESATLLRKNVEINSVKNVTIIEKAVADRVGNLMLYVNKINRGNHQIFNSGENRERIEIRSTTLDAFFENKVVKIDWIKMDIEGAELRALKGMKNILKQNPQLIIVTEVFENALKSAGTSAEEYLLALEKSGFVFDEIDERRKKIKQLSTESLIRRFVSGKINQQNIICYPFGLKSKN